MKLNKGKFGLIFIVFLSAALLFTIGVGVTATDYELTKDQFKALTGDYLSNGTVDGEEIEPGDTLFLDFPTVVQEEPLLIDLENVALRPVDEYNTVVIEQNWKEDLTPPPPPEGATAATADDDNIYDYVDASIVIFKSGITLDSLEFKPSSPPGGDGPANAIEVDCCFVGAETLRFHNLLMPTSDATGGFINGIKFDGSVAGMLSCGGSDGVDYIGGDRDPIEFKDVRVEGSHAPGIQGNGVVFTENVGDVANVNFEELYVGDVSTYPAGFDPADYPSYPADSGNGILFNNNGYVKDVTWSKSDRTSPSVSELPFAIEKNVNHGILVDGATVTKLDDLKLNYTRLEDNGGAGIFVRADYTAGDAISTVGMNIKNTLIEGNDLGIAVTSDLENPDYSPVKVDGVELGENLRVYDNTNGGALFDVQVVDGTKSSPGMTVVDSQFNDSDTSDTEDNDQAFGLRVDAYEGIFGMNISGSTFHGQGLDTDEVNGYTGTGIELATPIGEVDSDGDEYYDSVEGVTVEDTSAQYNEGRGLLVSANVVKNVDISSTGSSHARFSGNDASGIEIYGPDRINDLSVTGETDGGEMLADANGEYGLFLESEDEIQGIDVKNAEFGDERNVTKNGNVSGGVGLVTTSSDSIIGGSDEEDVLSFDNVVANGNEGNGMEIISAGSFHNRKDNVLVGSSEFKLNKEDGFYLVAVDDVENPVIEDSVFLENEADTAGIFITAGNDVKGSSGTNEIRGNTVAGNVQGIVIGVPVDNNNNSIGAIRNFSLVDNTTEHPDDEDKNGNSEVNMALVANRIESVNVKNNRFIGPYEENIDGEPGIGLRLTADESSSDILVEQNLFDSEASGYCIGDGIAIELDALDTDVLKNEFHGFSTAIQVWQENSNVTEAENTSNHINRNNILGCCVTIDAENLDYEDGQKVDATDNFWGEDQTVETISNPNNMLADTSNPLDQIYVDPLRDEPVDVVDGELDISLSITPTEPGTNETVQLGYELENTSGSSIEVSEIMLTLTDAEGNYIEEEKQLKTNVSVPGNDSKSFTYEFTTTDARGQYEADISADGYSGTKNFEVGVVEPDVKKPFWGSDADSSQSGILPAPIRKDGGETPFLELANEDGESVFSYVTVKSVKVFDFALGGRKVLEIEDNFDNMSQLENLNEGLYHYAVKYQVNGEDAKMSPILRFLVRK